MSSRIRSACANPRSNSRVGFSLAELLVVLAVTVVLTSILFPAFQSVRENALRLTCASNQRQIGAATILFATDHQDRLPSSAFASGPLCRPQEMMACTLGETVTPVEPIGAGLWEGIGWLVSPTGGRYLDSPSCLYCRSHHGEHPYERYAEQFEAPTTKRIYTNYHYIGDRSLSVDQAAPRRLQNSHDEILLTDGMRTRSDYNHEIGANVLHGDCAVSWYQDVNGQIIESMPLGELAPGAGQASTYNEIWTMIVRESVGPMTAK